MRIYNKEGWVNWPDIVAETKAFCMVVGARGTGKTYGLMRYLLESGKRFLYVRRLKTQLDACGKPDGNPFKRINTDLGTLILPYKSGSGIRFHPSEANENGKYIPVGDPVALGVALSTFATVRGADYSDIDYIVFDEAIAMIGEKPINNEFTAFLNFYETVNRNREILGNPPVKCFLLGNANKLGNPYFLGWGFMRIALNMIRGNQMVFRTQDKTRIMIMLLNSPISAQKRETVLYQNGSSDFMSMALDNAFRTDETDIRSRNLQEYNHVVSIGDIGIYTHKSTRDIYVSRTISKDNYYDDFGIKLTMFRHDYQILKIKYLAQRIQFEDYESELIFREYLEIN
ncbi:MAG: phage DNA encapsidation protein [Clostridia bacterium]|nr:phage DNA encapsidation protein [Clostridia bacterium]